MKKKLVIYAIYILFILNIFFISATFAKYVTSKNPEMGFQIGSTLYFSYQRHELYRNDQLIVGVETEYVEDGEVCKRIETMNVIPGDNLIYHFYVSNFNELTGEKNVVDGLFYPNAKTSLSLPMNGKIYDVDCLIQYRQIAVDENPVDNVWKNLVEGGYINLPPFDEQKVKYEFKITVVIDDQIENTTSDDYFDATLSINLFINAASDN